MKKIYLVLICALFVVACSKNDNNKSSVVNGDKGGSSPQVKTIEEISELEAKYKELKDRYKVDIVCSQENEDFLKVCFKKIAELEEYFQFSTRTEKLKNIKRIVIDHHNVEIDGLGEVKIDLIGENEEIVRHLYRQELDNEALGNKAAEKIIAKYIIKKTDELTNVKIVVGDGQFSANLSNVRKISELLSQKDGGYEYIEFVVIDKKFSKHNYDHSVSVKAESTNDVLAKFLAEQESRSVVIAENESLKKERELLQSAVETDKNVKFFFKNEFEKRNMKILSFINSLKTAEVKFSAIKNIVIGNEFKEIDGVSQIEIDYSAVEDSIRKFVNRQDMLLSEVEDLQTEEKKQAELTKRLDKFNIKTEVDEFSDVTRLYIARMLIAEALELYGYKLKYIRTIKLSVEKNISRKSGEDSMQINVSEDNTVGRIADFIKKNDFQKDGEAEISLDEEGSESDVDTSDEDVSEDATTEDELDRLEKQSDDLKNKKDSND